MGRLMRARTASVGAAPLSAIVAVEAGSPALLALAGGAYAVAAAVSGRHRGNEQTTSRSIDDGPGLPARSPG